jgi:hypothetical protein
MSAVQDLNRSPAARASILVTSKREEIVIATSPVTVLPSRRVRYCFVVDERV